MRNTPNDSHEQFIVQMCAVGIVIPEQHADFRSHYIVTQDITPVVKGAITKKKAETTLTVQTSAEPKKTLALSDAEMGKAGTPFLGGIKIGGQTIAKNDPETCDLLNRKGQPLGIYMDIGVIPLADQFHRIAIVSTDLDVTARNGAPLTPNVSVIVTQNGCYIGPIKNDACPGHGFHN
jgi:hypothetical protein